jgi:mannitol-specific phosphotransferase system IIBC component
VAFLKYSLIRLALFAPLFLLFNFLGLGALMSVVCAALIAFAVSYLFFQKQRDEAASALQHRFSGKAKPLRSAGEVEDAVAEDSLLDANPDAVIRTDAKDPRAKDSRTQDRTAKGPDNS